MKHFGTSAARGLLSLTFLFVAASTLALTTVSTAFGPETFRGVLAGTRKETRTFSANPGSLTSFRLQLVNADGKDHAQQNCSGLSLLKKLSCGLENLADALYVATIRTQWVEVTLNGQKVVSKTEFDKNVAVLSRNVTAQNSNTIVFEYKSGLLASYFSGKIESEATEIPNVSPIAGLSFTTETDFGSLLLKADGTSSSDPDGLITEFLWDFGDGQSATGPTIEHEYGQPGTYQVALTVKDDRGATHAKTLAVVVQDTRAPRIVSAILPTGSIYSKTLPVIFDATVGADEPLSEASLGGQSLQVAGAGASGTMSLSSGQQNLTLTVKDRWGNPTVRTTSVNIIFDETPPLIATISETLLTNRLTYDIPVQITDVSPTFTELWVNGDKVFGTGAKDFVFNISLSREGNNEIKVTSTDAAGNIALEKQFAITRDTTAPVIQLTSPTPNSPLGTVLIPIQGSSDETLAGITANGMALPLGADKKTFTGNYIAPGQGAHNITVTAADLAGNSTSTVLNLQISVPLLVPQLISLSPRENEVFIIGAQGAARPNLEITAAEGIFGLNRDTRTVNADGSFTLKLSPFSQATVSIKDSSTGEQASTTVTFAESTRLSGLIQDVDGNPLPGATLKIQGTTLQTTTSGTGAFSFSNVISGDQTLIVDGSTIPQSVTGASRKFSTLKIGLNIGLNQENVLPRPVFLTPLLIDGSQTPIAQNQSATVQSVHAPGVALSVPAGASTFPDGQKAGVINMMTVAAARATGPTPESFAPAEVVSLEPSGLKFSQKVEVTLPNSFELPANTDMVILSLNSAKGSWEVDGLASVSADGNTVKTKPGHGISHFSTIYAVPIAPILKPVTDSATGAYDITKESLATSVQLPSFKYGEQKVTPQLIYKSAWARPTAYVSNIIDIPEQTLSFETVATGQGSSYERVFVDKKCSWFLGIRVKCKSFYADIYNDTFYDIGVKYSSWIVPQAIKSQFFVSSVKAEQQFGDPQPFSGTVSTELFSDAEYTGFSEKPTNSVINQSLPQRSLISYAVDLKNDNGEYLPSGIYPTLARYEITLKNMTLRTTRANISSNTYIRGDVTHEDRNNVYNKTSSTLEATILQDILPSDVAANIVVQNKVRSAYGRGWHLAGAQKILNPESSNVVIEEADGSVSGYELNNTIVTAYKPASSEIKLDQAVDLSRWPLISANKLTAANAGSIVQIDTLNPNNPVTISQLPRTSGTIGNEGNYLCPSTNFTGNFTTTSHSYKLIPRVMGLVRFPDGTLYGTDQREHSVFKIGSAYQKLAGATTPTEEIAGTTVGFNMPTELLNQFCLDTFGAACGTPTPVATYACSQVRCTGGTICLDREFIDSTGESPVSGFRGDGRTGYLNSFPALVQLNSPMGVAVTQEGNVVVADTGNNRVRLITPSTATISTIVGNGTNSTFPAEGGTSLNVPVFHPRGLLLDSDGGLYITTEDGFILKRDSLGNVAKIAGLPLSLGGVYANQGHASVMAFNKPYGMTYDQNLNHLYVADTGNNRVVRIDLASGQANTVAGDGTCDSVNPRDNNPAAAASLCAPTQLALDGERNLVIVEAGRNSIRKVIFNRTSSSQIAFAPIRKDLSTLVRNLDGTWVRTFRDGLKIGFNAIGQQVTTTERSGRATRFEYDGSDLLSRILLPSGQEIRYEYTAAGKLRRITDAANRSTEFDYNGDQLSVVRYPDGSTQSFGYGANGLLARETNQRGFATSYSYNEYNRFVSAQLPDQTTVTATDYISRSLGSGQDNQVPLNGQGNEADQNRSTYADGKGQPTEILYDIHGLAAVFTDAKGRQTIMKRDFNGLLTESHAPNGRIKKFIYDPNTNDLLKIQDVLGETQVQDLVIRQYNGFGQITSETDIKGKATSITYDAPTGATKSVQNGNKTLLFGHDANGFVSTRQEVSTGQTVTTSFERDVRGFITKITTSDGRITLLQNDSAGNVLSRTETTSGGQSAVTVYEYDAFNRLKKVISPNGESTEYSYLTTGELSAIKDAKGRIASFDFDRRGRVTKKTDFDGVVESFTYDGNGNVAQHTAAGGGLRKFTYDEVDQLIKAELPDDTILYSYDAAGEMELAQNNVSKIEMARDFRGRLTHSRLTGAGELSSYPAVDIAYAYDSADRLLGRTSSFGNASYSYDTLERINGLASASGNAYVFAYNDLNRLTGISRPGSATAIAYTNAGLIESLTHSAGGATKSFTGYSFDPRGIVSQKRSPAGVENYAYDLNGQLTGASGILPESFTYDTLGNRLADSHGSSQYDSSTDRLTEDWQYIYSYDAAGNLIAKIPKETSQKAFQYAYNSKNQLIEAKVLSSALGQVERRLTYAYDALGRRLEKRVFENSGASSARRYVYEHDNVIAELDGGNTLLARYDHSGIAVDDVLGAEVTAAGASAGLAANSGKYFFLKDALGSITDIVDGSGQIIQRYEYTAFGSTRAIRDSAGNDISATPLVSTSYRFAGREWDAETGLSYNRARYYDPGLGRFLQKDPDPGKLKAPSTVVNRYIYVGNIPTTLTDPSGKFWWYVVAFAASFAINYFTAKDSGASEGQAFTSGLIGGIAGLIAPGVGSYLAGQGVSATTAFIVGNIAAGAFNGAANAAVFGGNIGEGALLGGGSGLVAGGLQIGASAAIYDLGLNAAASRMLSEPFGYFGGLAINTGQEFNEDRPDGTSVYRIVPAP